MRLLRLSIAVVLVIALLLSLLAGAVLVWVLPEHVGSIVVDGRRFTLDHLDAGHWLMASGGVFVAMLVILMIVPLVLFLTLAVPLLVAGLLTVPALVVVAALLALFAWPIAWLVKRLTR